MNFAKNKTAYAIALFLMLTVAVSLVALPAANAHDPPIDVPTYAYISAAPDPVGVGQQVTVVFWLNWMPPTASGIAGDRWWYMLDITDPNDNKQTIGPLKSDPVGGSYYMYTPDETGTYTLTIRFGPQLVTGDNGTGIYNGMSFFGPVPYLDDTFLASSATTTLIVQDEAIPDPPVYPLPTEYWTRPIEGQNNEWYQVASNWMGDPHIVGDVQPDGVAPNSPHIMWTKPLEEGGVVGGSNTFIDGATFYDGTAYQGKFSAPLIMNGRLYYPVPKSDTTAGTFGSSGAAGGYACVDLRTGEEIFWQNISMPTFGQLFYYESMNQHGVVPNGYLWTSDENPWAAFFGLPPTPTTWDAYDPIDGNWLFSLTNVPGGTDVYGPNGEILRYVLNSTANWLACWNNTAAHGLTAAFSPSDTTSSSYYQWRPTGKTVDASEAYSWNVTIPSLPGPSSPSIVKIIPDDLVFGTSTSFYGISDWGTPDPWTMWAINLKPESRGNLLWLEDYQAPAGDLTLYQGPVDPETRVFTMWCRDGLYWSGYSLDDGSLLWTTEPEDEWAFYAHTTAVADGKLYSCGINTVYCYDLNDGSLLWNYSDPSGLATPYPNYPLAVTTVADGKVYVGTIEHSCGAPYWKGAQLHCLNATTGDAIWTMLMHTPSTAGGLGAITTGYAVADGYYVTLNLYDMQIYCIGKGPSATSVSASPKVSVHGGSVLVEGSVIDIAAGTGQNEQAARFPNGVPAVSDESMGDWMEYVYMQKPRPADVTGVEIVVSVLDPNDNSYEIGRTTSDANGFFKLAFEPLVPGEYTVIATFEGSESYYGSHAVTAINVEEAPAATPVPTPPPASVADMYLLPSVAGIIVAIVVIGILIILMLRKR